MINNPAGGRVVPFSLATYGLFWMQIHIVTEIELIYLKIIRKKKQYTKKGWF